MYGTKKTGQDFLDLLKTGKAKVGATASGAIVATTNSSAAVTVDGTTGVLAGSIDTAMYSSAIPIVVGFIAFGLAVYGAIGLLKKARP